jgi:hypothetical protein
MPMHPATSHVGAKFWGCSKYNGGIGHCGGSLTPGRLGVPLSLVEQLARAPPPSRPACQVCADNPIEAACPSCGYELCHRCVAQFVEGDGRCPHCRSQLSGSAASRV